MPVSTSQTFRVFVSSTFADLVAERDALQEDVLPRLRALCEQHGARFSWVDLRWGVSPEAAQDRRTMSICLDEIRRCQKTTARPNFIVLLGGRYGWRPLPAAVTTEDFEELRRTEAMKPRLSRFESLYTSIDRNAVPAAYCLTAQHTADSNEAAIELEVLDTLDDASVEAKWPLTKRAAYGGSATEQEIVCGLLDEKVLPSARDHVHAFLNNIRDRDDETRLLTLKGRLRDALGVNAHDYDGGDGEASRRRRLCDDVYAALASTITREIERVTRAEPLDREIEAHDAFGAERERIFVGRAGILGRVEVYLAGLGGKVFALIGPSGSGKSSAMARACARARREHPAAVVVTRFIGTTPESSSGATLLRSLTAQIARRYGGSAPASFAEYPRMAAAFRECLTLARPERPLILFLDALDQLPPFDAAAGLSWLPLNDLPPHVHVVTSSSTDARALVTIIQQKLDAENVAPLDAMPPEEGANLFDRWLAEARRDVQPDQRRTVIDGFARSGLPLYLRLAFEEARLWRSFDGVQPLGDDALAIIRQTFARLSDAANHGEPLIRRSLGYLTAAKEGLTEEEIVDVLSRDDEVMADFRGRFPNSPKADRLPLVIWSRLYYDLQPYLTERGGLGGAVLDFFHRQMRRVAAADYLDPHIELEWHRALAEYFRSTPDQPAPDVYNARKLTELPFQLRKARMWEELEATLCDLAFVEAKCAAGLIYDLIADYQAAVRTDGLPAAAKERIESFGRFVRAQANLLSTHPHVTFQQALNEPDSTAPAQAAARLAASDTRPRFRWIGKSQQASLCEQTLYGHTTYVNGCDVSPDGTHIASAGSDGEVKIWNAETGQEMLRLRGASISMESCHYSPDGTRLVAGTRDGKVIVWDTTSGSEVWTIRAHDRPVPCCRFSHDGNRIVSASWDSRVKLLDAGTGDELFTIDAHKGDACWAEFSSDDTGLISVGGDGLLKWWDASTGREVRSVKAHDSEAMSCRFSSDGRFIVTAAQDMQVKRWDASSFEMLNSYDGHAAGVWAAAISSDGRLLVTGAGDGCVKVWEVESGVELASTTEHTHEVWGLAFFDDSERFVSAAWDWTVKVWNAALAVRDVDEAAGSKPQSTEAARLWGYMIACGCSPDGGLIAAGSQDGSVRLWDAKTGRPEGVFPLHHDFVFACAWSPDSRWIVSGAWDGTLEILDARQRRASAHASLSTTIASCVFTPDGTRVVAVTAKEIGIWDFDDGELRPHAPWPSQDPLTGCAVLPDGIHIVTGVEDGRLRLLNMETRQEAGELPGHSGLIMFAVSPDGRRLAATSEQGVVWIWDLVQRAEMRALSAHRERVVACNFSPDGTRLISGSWDGTARIWDLDAADEPIVLEGHLDQVQDCCFTPDGSRALTASVDGTLRVWDARSGVALGELLSPPDAVSVCAMSLDGGIVASGSSRHAVRLWNGETGGRIGLLAGHEEAVRACVFLLDGTLVSASADGTLRLCTTEGVATPSILGRHDGPVSSCARSPDGSWVASGGQDRRVRLWDARTGAALATLAGHDDWVRLVLILPNGQRVISCSLDRTVRVWDVATGRTVHVLRGHGAALSVASISRDGSRLVTGAGDGTLCVWDLETGDRQLTLSGHRGGISGCAFADRIVSAARDGTLRIWDADTGETLAEMTGHSQPVHACALSPDGRHVASASEDSFVVLWDAATGEKRAEYWVGSPALSVTWHPTRRRIAVGAARGNLHLLEVEGLT